MDDQRDSGRPAARPAVEPDITIDVDRLIRWIFLIAVGAQVAVVFLDFGPNYSRWIEIGPIRRLFNVTREDALASWVGVTQTVLVAVTLWLVYSTMRITGAATWRRRGWLLMASFYTYMALDDGTKLHERLGTAAEMVRKKAGAGDGGIFDLFPSYAWQVVFLPLFGMMGLFVLFFVWREATDRNSRLFVASAIGLYIFAVSLDFVEGLEPEHSMNLYTRIAETFDMEEFTRVQFRNSTYDSLRHFSKSIEEFAEMFATTLLWTVFIRRLAAEMPSLRMRFTSRS
ncbi:MAG: hypothetical protein GY716_13185 [bacterium]|nr:hypothetical protein [bacterium]